jgi:hypothetical protein
MNITKKTFEGLSTGRKLDAIYDSLEDLHAKIKRRGKIDTGLTAATGFLGGVCAVAAKWMFIKG